MRLTILAIVALVFLTSVGCGGTSPTAGPSFGSEDGRKISQLIDRLNDDKSTSGTLQRLFAAGVKLAAADFKKYPLYAYEVKGDPVISGDTATATISLRSEQKGSEVGTKEWAFVKEGGDWKIKAAPLP